MGHTSRSSLAKPFSTTALNQALEGVSFAIPLFTIHDMRRTGSTLLHEKGFPSDVIEKALNHTIGGVRGVYNRAEYSDAETSGNAPYKRLSTKESAHCWDLS